MTTQVLEEIIYAGKNELMLGTPLESYFGLIESGIYFQHVRSNCWRGYVGQWEIIDGRVYLIGFRTGVGSGKQLNLVDIFPNFSERVFAHWITGVLRVPQGEWVNYRYERFINLHVEAGVIDSTLDDISGSKEIGPRAVKSPNSPPFQVEKSDLIDRFELSEVEKKSIIEDPLEAVPSSPFGHLNHKWELFKSHLINGDEVWSFSSIYNYRLPFREKRSGFSILRGQTIVAYFLTNIETLRSY